MQKPEPQYPLLLKECYPLLECAYVWENEREIGIIWDRLDPFQRVQQVGTVLVMRGEDVESFFVRRRSEQHKKSDRPRCIR